MRIFRLLLTACLAVSVAVSAELPDPAWANLGDPVRSVRDAAVEALASASDKEVEKRALLVLAEKNPLLRSSAVSLLIRLRGVAALKALAPALRDESYTVRATCCAALAALANGDAATNPALIQSLITLSSDKDLRIRMAALAGLGRCVESRDAMQALTSHCRAVPEEEARAAVELLRTAHAKTLLKIFSRQISDGEVRDRVIAANSLAQIGGEDAIKVLLAGASNNGAERMWEVRAAICDALAAIVTTAESSVEKRDRDRVEQVLLAMLSDNKWGTRASAATALGRLGSRAGLGALIENIDGKDNEPYLAIVRLMTGQPFERKGDWLRWAAANRTAAIRPLPEPKSATAMSFYDIPDTTANVVFVLDTSGSMADTGAMLNSPYHQKDREVKSKLKAATDELYKTVVSLEQGTRFNIVFFSTGVALWNDGPVFATWRARARVREHIEVLKAVGATNASGSLEMAIDQYAAETVYFLTDGMPTAGEKDTTRLVEQITLRNNSLNTPARIHTIAFFLAEDQGFLKNLAKGNGGNYALRQ
jgi:HEAT repeat protein